MGGDFEWIKPNYKKYKIDSIPELLKIQEMLKKEGLHDPWLRNHAWKYMLPPIDKQFPYFGRNGIVLKGMAHGVIFGSVFIVLHQIYRLAFGSKSNDSSHH